MRRITTVLFLILAGPVLGQEWQKLSGAEIEAALAGARLVYEDGAWQEFRPSGVTTYNAGTDSAGRWTVRGDRYCSQWPPADGWACYDMARRGADLRFVGESGDATIGRPE